MKSLNFIKLLLVAGIVTFSSCNNGNKDNSATSGNDSSANMTEEKNDAKFNKTGEKDANALVEAYLSSLAEQRLSDSVSHYTRNSAVKSLAMTMAKAHAEINKDIADLASKKQITLPSDLSVDDADRIKKFSNKKPKDLNKDYVDKLISDHQDAITLFDKDTSIVMDTDIKMWFANALPVLRKHLDMSMDCQKKLGQ